MPNVPHDSHDFPAVALCAIALSLAACSSAPQAPTPIPGATKATANPVPTHSAVAPPIKRTPVANPGEMEEAASKKSPVIGAKATEFSLPDPNEKVIKLSDLKGKWTVLYFYPADDTPGCTCQATEFTDLLARFHNLNAVVLGVSPDPPVLHQIFTKKYSLKITLLSDPGHETMKAYGAWVESRIGNAKIERVVRSTFLIDPEGMIAWHWPEVIPEGHAERVRDRLAKIAAERGKSALRPR